MGKGRPETIISYERNGLSTGVYEQRRYIYIFQLDFRNWIVGFWRCFWCSRPQFEWIDAMWVLYMSITLTFVRHRKKNAVIWVKRTFIGLCFGISHQPMRRANRMKLIPVLLTVCVCMLCSSKLQFPFSCLFLIQFSAKFGFWNTRNEVFDSISYESKTNLEFGQFICCPWQQTYTHGQGHSNGTPRVTVFSMNYYLQCSFCGMRNIVAHQTLFLASCLSVCHKILAFRPTIPNIHVRMLRVCDLIHSTPAHSY